MRSMSVCSCIVTASHERHGLELTMLYILYSFGTQQH